MRFEYFQMIDHVASFDGVDKRLVAHAAVPGESSILENHFPGYPILPGVLMTETMAQAAGFLMLGLLRFSKMPFLAGVKDARFRSSVTYNARLIVEARLVQLKPHSAIVKTKIDGDAKNICSAGLMFHLAFLTTSMGEAMLAEARRVGLVTEAA
ncbi:MAG: beta-hydroxyacyl-ACP dehydratase [Bradyrhizobiaceae bacterium]|nr:beta-hydroxyacyl-ACP dehydratase [Bradyrhizobiaceae bacterium]